MRKLLLLLAVVVLAGCSTHAMKSQPLWGQSKEEEERPIEIAFEGTNAWPIYYQRGDEVAVLWPLFASTENGHAVALLYEYLREERTLRVLQLFPWLPSYARFQPEKKAWYVFPYFTWLRKNPEEQKHPKPTWRSGERIVFLFPFYYNSPSTFWTPLFSDQRFSDNPSIWHQSYYHRVRGDARRTGILGPLFFHESSEVDGHRQLYAPFPLVGAWWKGRSTGFQAFPIVYYKHGSDKDRYFNILGLLFHYQAVHYDNNMRGEHFNLLAWPLFYWGTDWMDEEELIRRRHERLMQTKWRGTITDETEPERNTLDEVTTTWYRVMLLGIYQHRRKIELKGFAEFPVGSEEPSEWEFSTRGRTTTRLFPLFSTTRWDDGESSSNILWQLYNGFSKHRASGEMYTKRTVLWRLYRHERLGDQSLTDVFPFISTARDREAGRSRWTLAGGLFERRTEEGTRTTKLLWIPVSRKAVRSE